MAIALALAAFVLAVLLHGLAIRVPLRLDSVRRFLLVGHAARPGAGGGFARLLWTVDSRVCRILLYALLCELYIFCFTLVLSSVSATMPSCCGRGRFRLQLRLVTTLKTMVKLRLDRLLKIGLIEQYRAVSP